MAPKWFSSSDDNDVLTRLGPMTVSTPTPPRPKKPSTNSSSTSRLSATFTDSRPWTLMSSARSSDRSSSSSRKRHSFFGSRSSGSSFGTTSADPFSSSSISSPREATFPPNYSRTESRLSIHQPECFTDQPRPSSAMSNNSKATVFGPDTRRSLLFSRGRSARSLKTASMAAEPFSRLLRGDSRSSNLACPSVNPSEDESERNFYHKWKKKSISSPFNFQHVTHTQQEHLPELKSVTDGELVSEFWAASAYQAPEPELRGIKVNAIESHVDYLQLKDPMPQLDSENDFFTFTHGPLAGMSSNLSVDRVAPDGNSPDVDDSFFNQTLSRPSPEIRSRSFSHSSTSSRERLNLGGIESREPPTLIHPALRGQNTASSTDKPLPPDPIYELPANSLESVPEELEDSNFSPTKTARGGTWLDLSPPESPRQSSHSSPSLAPTVRNDNGLVFAPFPMGNAFAQAYGGDGAEIPVQSINRLSFGGENSTPSLTSGESWENDIEFCYLVEAESTCDFDWQSLSESRKGSASGESRRESTANMSTRGTSVHEDTLTRPTSQGSSINAPSEDYLFAGFDGCSNFDKDSFDRPSPVTTAPQAAPQYLHHSPMFARAFSSENVSARALSPIIESPARVAANKENRNSLAVVYPVKPLHTRSISDEGNRQVSTPRDRSVRWSIATPACVPEDIRRRKSNFTSNLHTSIAEQMLFGAPVLPPPRKELPPVPGKHLPLTPPISPPTLYTPEFTALRRPSSSQDRAILQAAGRTVQRGRNSSGTRQTTPSRLSHVQSALEPSTRSVIETPVTPTKTGPIQFKLAVFQTPPTSPFQQQREFPAWI